MNPSAVRWLSPGGIRMRVLDEGNGPAALVLHGFTGCAESMQVVTDGLSAARRVIRPDLIGHGESAAPDDPAAYTVGACVDQLLGMLDQLGVERVDGIGYSMGGRIALSLAAAAPRRVRSLGLIGASAGLASASERSARVAADEALATRILTQGVEAFVDHWMSLPLFASQRRLGEDALAHARAERLRCRATGLAGSLRGMGTGAMPPLHAALPTLKLPVRCFVGEEDAKFRAIASELATALPNAQVEIVPEAGHAVHLENPRVFTKRLAAFLAEVDAAERDGGSADTSRSARRPVDRPER